MALKYSLKTKADKMANKLTNKMFRNLAVNLVHLLKTKYGDVLSNNDIRYHSLFDVQDGGVRELQTVVEKIVTEYAKSTQPVSSHEIMLQGERYNNLSGATHEDCTDTVVAMMTAIDGSKDVKTGPEVDTTPKVDGFSAYLGNDFSAVPERDLGGAVIYIVTSASTGARWQVAITCGDNHANVVIDTALALVGGES